MYTFFKYNIANNFSLRNIIVLPYNLYVRINIREKRRMQYRIIYQIVRLLSLLVTFLLILEQDEGRAHDIMKFYELQADPGILLGQIRHHMLRMRSHPRPGNVSGVMFLY